MKLIGIVLLTILSSCQAPKITFERCVLSLQYSKVRCVQYLVSLTKVGPISDGVDHPISYVDNGVVVRLETWGEIHSFFVQDQEYIKLHCKNTEVSNELGDNSWP